MIKEIKNKKKETKECNFFSKPRVPTVHRSRNLIRKRHLLPWMLEVLRFRQVKKRTFIFFAIYISLEAWRPMSRYKTWHRELTKHITDTRSYEN